VWGLLFFFQAEDGIRDRNVTGVQTCALPIYGAVARRAGRGAAGPHPRPRRGRFLVGGVEAAGGPPPGAPPPAALGDRTRRPPREIGRASWREREAAARPPRAGQRQPRPRWSP